MSTAFISSKSKRSHGITSWTYPPSLPVVRPKVASLSFVSLNASSSSFDPIVPDATTLLGFSIVVVVCAVAAYVWSNQVVPVSRTKLAMAKQKNSNSELRQYLDELLDVETNATVTGQTRTITASTVNVLSESVETAWSEGIGSDSDTPPIDATKGFRSVPSNDRAFERWLFTDWLEQDKRRKVGGRQKEPAIPILKNAKWNSGDNPILAATALISVGVLLSAITERIASSI
jgi:hypothetical protein